MDELTEEKIELKMNGENIYKQEEKEEKNENIEINIQQSTYSNQHIAMQLRKCKPREIYSQ